MLSTRHSLLPLFALVLATPAIAGSAGDEKTPEQLVQQLGDARFIERQLATEELTRRGLSALEAVRAGTEHSDPEIRFRSRSVLRAIRHLERQRLINAFIAGLEVETADELPGWTDFKRIAGEAANDRTLFVQMLEAEWAFLDAVYQSDATLTSSLLANRCQSLKTMQSRRPIKPITIGNLAALVLVAAREDVALGNQSYLMHLLYSNSDLDRAMKAGTYREALRKLMGAVVGKYSVDGTLVQRLNFALKYSLAEGVVPARKVLADRLGAPHDRQYAILVLTKLGEEKDEMLIDAMLDDSGVVASHHRVNNVKITTQVRDIALAALVHKAGKQFKDYGMPRARLNPTNVLSQATVGFTSEAAREEAIAKWRRDQLEPADATAP